MTEDNDAKSDTNCMDQEPVKKCLKCGKPLMNLEKEVGMCADCAVKEPQKALPAPNKDEMYHLNIDVRDLFTKIPQHECAENEMTWHSQEEMSKEFIELKGELMILAMYIARHINEGPEVKDNVNKRLILSRQILGMILDNLSITGYDAYGMLIEMQQSLFMRIDGRKQIMVLLAQMEQAKAIAAQKQSAHYTS
jgi:hypothetical protein